MKQSARENRINEHGQPIGWSVPDWQPRPRPGRDAMVGRTCELVCPDLAVHGDDLFAAHELDESGQNWTYLATGPFNGDRTGFDTWFTEIAVSEDPLHYVVLSRDTGKAIGSASLMRIDPANGVIEVGYITMTPLLQRTAMATEAMYLMMRRAFDELGYRRYEWKCDALNAPSRRAAERLGFTYEGTFRQAIVTKSRNRDTAWFSILDSEWPSRKAALEAWLDPSNFDDEGRQKRRLEDLRAG